LASVLNYLGDAVAVRVVDLSHRGSEPTKSYDLPLTGAGQVLALGAVAPSIARSYGWRWRWRESFTIVAAEKAPEHLPLGGNLIVLGGEWRNSVTKEIVDCLGSSIGVWQGHLDQPNRFGDILIVRQHDGEDKDFGGTPENSGGSRQLEKDFGLILRMPNPYDENRRNQCLIFAGVHTYGTAGAAMHFAKRRWDPRWWNWWRAGIVAVVEVEIRHGRVVHTKLAMPIRRLTTEEVKGWRNVEPQAPGSR
jgi:hypothetical protein